MRQAAVAAVRAETQRAIDTSHRLMEQLALSEGRAYRKILETRETIAATRRLIASLRDVRADIGQFGSDGSDRESTLVHDPRRGAVA